MISPKLLFMAALWYMASFVQANVPPQKQNDFFVIAYYSGSADEIDKYPVEKLTHIIYSFVHLKGNQLTVDDKNGDTIIRRLVSLKSRNPKLKVILSLGGWGGCEPCSDAFSTPEGREAFARSAKALLVTYHADGIDLDWEYPAIEGYPGHTYRPADKQNFTALVRELRKTFGDTYEISFAAGGFNTYLKNSIEWDQISPLVNVINLMSYDLINGYSTVTGHHTALYSTGSQAESTDNAVRYLDSIGVPLHKIVIGAAFYARTWGDVDNRNHGLYQSGKFKDFVVYRNFNTYFAATDGYTEYWDSIAQAPYRYSPTKKIFATYDNPRSVAIKTRYVMNKRLGGIMFWELSGDAYQNGCLDAIDQEKKQKP